MLSQALLIKTKLLFPQISQDRILRPRITDHLNSALRYPLTLVSSLAGSGKTTALVEWARQLSVPAAWFSIDEGDNDPNRFLAYFVTALQSIIPGTDQAVLEALHSPEPLPVENWAALLINDLTEVKTDFVLVLDDYHLVKSAAVRKAVFFFIEHIPQQMHLVIAARADPGLPLARLRARNRVLELRIDQLRFTPAETKQYLNQVMRLGLTEKDLTILIDRTEGWIAGVQMAALSLRGHSDGEVFIQAFSGSSRFILDYLVEEVLDRQTGAVQTFLLQTSILERMCGSLCDAVTGYSAAPGEVSGQDMLEYLNRANLFLVPLDNAASSGAGTPWYRYHHLFRDLLRARLAHKTQRQNQKVLHNRASLWYELNGLFEEAVHHALAAQDNARTAQLIEQIAEDAWLRGQYATVLKWIQSLPPEIVKSRPWLCVWNAWSLTQMGTLQDIQKWIDAAQTAAGQRAGTPSLDAPSGDSPGAQALEYQIATLQALLAGLSQDYDRAVALARPVLENPIEQKPRSALFARCNITHGLSSMFYTTGEFERTSQACLETIRVAQQIGFTLRYVHAVNKLAYVYQVTGQPHRGYLLLHEALSLLRSQGLENYFAAGILRCRLIDLLYEWNRLEDARRLAEEHLRPEMMGEVPYLLVDFYNVQARDLLLKRDFNGAQNVLDRYAVLAQRSYIWQALAWQSETIQVRLWLRSGELSLAAAWAKGLPPAPAGDIPFSCEAREIARARVLLARGAVDEAQTLLNHLARSAEAGNRNGRLVEIRILAAAALHQAGKIDQAGAEIERAVTIAEPEGYVRAFVDAGSPVAAVLTRLVQAGRSPCRKYTARLLDAFANEMEAARTAVSPSATREDDPDSNPALVDPLSRRELEVLRCMASGLSNSAAARQMVIETSTVKRHINSIFAKLGVENRVQALNRARELGLL